MVAVPAEAFVLIILDIVFEFGVAVSELAIIILLNVADPLASIEATDCPELVI